MNFSFKLLLFLMKAIIVKSLDTCLTLNCFLKVTLRFFSFNILCATAKLLQSCPTLCDPMDSSPPGSSVPGILQARTVERAAISFCTVLIRLYGDLWLTLVSLACEFLRSKRGISFIFPCYFLAQCL